MNKSIIRYLLCRVVQFEGFFLLAPCIVALFYKESQGFVYAIVGGICIALGTLGAYFKPKNNVFFAREGFVTVSLSWIVLSIIGAIPFTITGEIPNYVDALFETASGFTTTGASIMTDVESMSQTSMFFRCFTNWVGGMGVLVFIMAVVPLTGSYNLLLMQAESTGPEVGKLVPRIKDSAKILYGIYFAVTVGSVIAFMVTGMNFYDALIISFSTTGTGGFANLNNSMAGYSYSAQTVAIVVMLICSINFNVYFLLLKGKIKQVFKLEEIAWYFALVALSTLGITVQIQKLYPNLRSAVHDALFQVVSIITTTGFSTTDYNFWPTYSKGIIILITIVGACAGSTAGGVKISRVIIALRNLKREIGKMIHPRSVSRVRLNGSTVAEETVDAVSTFFIAYAVLLIVSTLVISADVFDFETSVTAVITALSNVGPGLGACGPSGNFAGFSQLSKLVLTFDMIAGRLELFPMFILFYYKTWRKS